jgi:hypothetical protein
MTHRLRQTSHRADPSARLEYREAGFFIGRIRAWHMTERVDRPPERASPVYDSGAPGPAFPGGAMAVKGMYDPVGLALKAREVV